MKRMLFAWRGSWMMAVTCLLCDPSWAQITQRVSVDSGGAQGNDSSDYLPAVSADGRYVAFESLASNLVSGDTNGSYDIFVHDRVSGVTERVSVDSSGAQGIGDSVSPSISADGRYVAFISLASTLVIGDTNGTADVFVHDRLSGVTERVSVDSGGIEANDFNYLASISPDGRYVAFESVATNLVTGDTNGAWDVFVHDRQSGVTDRVSVDSGGLEGNGNSHLGYSPSISAGGRYVTFSSSATNLVIGDTNLWSDAFVHDRQSGATERVSVDSGGAEGNGLSEYASISADGRYVTFHSDASNLVVGDTNGVYDVFLRDRQLGVTERVSISSGGVEGDNASLYPSVSGDGRYVAFGSDANNLVSGDTNGAFDVFVRDRQSGVTERLSISSGGVEGNGTYSRPNSMSADGRFVAFWSDATNLVSGDTNGNPDVFIRDRDATVFTSLCEPGVGGVIGCPCANAPFGPGRGCNNFAPFGGTGGARLDGSGVPSISADTVSIDISDSLKQVHVLFVGTTMTANVRTGAGVRCVNSGINAHSQSFLKRIEKQTPTNGPPSTMSFVGIQAASLAKGAPPIAGETYYYYAAYRNAAANGAPGCPGFSFGFNATNAGSVTWYP